MYHELKEIELFARANDSKLFPNKAHPTWIIWAESFVMNGNDNLVTGIDNYHIARKVIKSCGKKCNFAIASGNCVTIFFSDKEFYNE